MPPTSGNTTYLLGTDAIVNLPVAFRQPIRFWSHGELADELEAAPAPTTDGRELVHATIGQYTDYVTASDMTLNLVPTPDGAPLEQPALGIAGTRAITAQLGMRNIGSMSDAMLSWGDGSLPQRTGSHWENKAEDLARAAEAEDRRVAMILREYECDYECDRAW